MSSYLPQKISRFVVCLIFKGVHRPSIWGCICCQLGGSVAPDTTRALDEEHPIFVGPKKETVNHTIAMSVELFFWSHSSRNGDSAKQFCLHELFEGQIIATCRGSYRSTSWQLVEPTELSNDFGLGPTRLKSWKTDSTENWSFAYGCLRESKLVGSF